MAQLTLARINSYAGGNSVGWAGAGAARSTGWAGWLGQLAGRARGSRTRDEATRGHTRRAGGRARQGGPSEGPSPRVMNRSPRSLDNDTTHHRRHDCILYANPSALPLGCRHTRSLSRVTRSLSRVRQHITALRTDIYNHAIIIEITA